MYKSTKKIWFITGGALLIIGGFAAATWAIVDQNNKIPRGHKLISSIRGYTEFSNVPYDAEKMSLHDWIYANRPTKLMYEKINDSWSNYYIYFFSDDKNKTERLEYVFEDNASTSKPPTKVDFKAYNSPELLMKVAEKEVSLLYARIKVETTNSSMNYHVESRDPINKNQWYHLGSSFNNFDKDKFLSTKVSTPLTNFEFSGSEGNVSSSMKLKNELNTWNTIKSTVTSNTNSTLFTYEFKEASASSYDIQNNTDIKGINYTIKQTNNIGSNMLSTFTEQIDLKNKFNVTDTNLNNKYKIYNVSHSFNGSPITDEKAYYGHWTPKINNSFADFHLPNDVGLIGFFRKL